MVYCSHAGLHLEIFQWVPWQLELKNLCGNVCFGYNIIFNSSCKGLSSCGSPPTGAQICSREQNVMGVGGQWSPASLPVCIHIEDRRTSLQTHRQEIETSVTTCVEVYLKHTVESSLQVRWRSHVTLRCHGNIKGAEIC